MFNKARHDRWVFGDRDSGAYLTKFAWTKIVRHQMVDGHASPDDPALTDYWAARKRRRKPPSTVGPHPAVNASTDAARSASSCCCTPTTSHNPRASGNSGSPRSAKAIRRQAITADQQRRTDERTDASRLVHTHCARKTTRRSDQLCTIPRRPGGLLEPDAGKLARPVLRGPRRGNASGLPAQASRQTPRRWPGTSCPISEP